VEFCGPVSWYHSPLIPGQISCQSDSCTFPIEIFFLDDLPQFVAIKYLAAPVNLLDLVLCFNAITRHEHQAIHDHAVTDLNLKSKLDHATRYSTPIMANK
jgi:hypothetical protein